MFDSLNQPVSFSCCRHSLAAWRQKSRKWTSIKKAFWFRFCLRLVLRFRGYAWAHPSGCWHQLHPVVCSCTVTFLSSHFTCRTSFTCSNIRKRAHSGRADRCWSLSTYLGTGSFTFLQGLSVKNQQIAAMTTYQGQLVWASQLGMFWPPPPQMTNMVIRKCETPFLKPEHMYEYV